MSSILLLAFIVAAVSAAPVAKEEVSYKLNLPKNSFDGLTKFAGMKLAPSKTAKRLRSKASTGYLLTSIYHGESCSQDPFLVSGSETNVCLVASDKNHEAIGSVIYQMENSKRITTEYSTLDCSGEPISTSSQFIFHKCYSNSETGTSATLSYQETATPWTSLSPGFMFMFYDQLSTCTSSPNAASIFDWQPFSSCMPATFGADNTPGSLQYTGCDGANYSLQGYSDLNCTVPFVSYTPPRPICIVNDFSGNDDDTNTRHLDTYETLACN